MSNAIEGILGVSMEKIREMVDVNTIIGDPISAPNGTTIIPVSIVIKTDGDVELLELGGAGKTSPLEGVVEAIPGVIGKIKDLVGKKNSDSADESDDAE